MALRTIGQLNGWPRRTRAQHLHLRGCMPEALLHQSHRSPRQSATTGYMSRALRTGHTCDILPLTGEEGWRSRAGAHNLPQLEVLRLSHEIAETQVATSRVFPDVVLPRACQRAAQCRIPRTACMAGSQWMVP